MSRARLNSNQWSILGLAAAALSTSVWSLYTVEHVKNWAIDLAARGETPALARLAGALRPVDIALAGVSLVVCILLVMREWRAHAFSKLLRTATPIQNFYILTILGAWLGHSYLFPGLLLAGDTGSHIARFLEMRAGFQEGVFPVWSNYQYLGSPLLEFTGPLTYVVGGFLDLTVKDPVFTAKVLLFVAHLATGWLFYGLMRRFGIIPPASLAAAIAMSGSFALLSLFLYRGVFPQAFTILFVILLFYAAEGLMRDTKHQARDWLLFVLSTAGIIINHQPHGFFAGAYLGLFSIASLLLGRWLWRNLPALIGAGTIGVIVSLFALVPMLAEADRVMISPELGLYHFHFPTLHRLALLVLWQNTRMPPGGTEWWAYLGLVFVGLALLGACSALLSPTQRAHRKLALVVFVCLLLSLTLYTPVVRDIIFVAFFVGIFAAIGMERLFSLAGPKSRLPLIVFVALVLDATSTSIQPLARSDKDHFIRAGEYLASTAPNERVIEAMISRDGSFAFDIGPDATPLSYYTTIPRVAGDHNLAATHVHNFAETIVKMAERDLRSDGYLSPSTQILVGILNAPRIVCFGFAVNGCPKSFITATPEGPLGEVVHIPNAAPVLFSQHLTLLEPSTELEKPLLWNEDYYAFSGDPRVTAVEEFLRRYLDAAKIDTASHTARAIPVRTLPSPLPFATTGDSPKQQVTRYSVSLGKIALRIESDASGYVQLSHPWYPDTEVQVNGRRIVPMRGTLDLMVLALHSGTNDIEIRPLATPLRLGLASLSCVALLVTFAVAYNMHRRRARRALA